MRMRAGISTGGRVLIHLRYRFILLGSAKPVLDHLINIAETPSPSSQTLIAFAFFLRSSFGRDNVMKKDVIANIVRNLEFPEFQTAKRLRLRLPRCPFERSRFAADAFACSVSAVWCEGIKLGKG